MPFSSFSSLRSLALVRSNSLASLAPTQPSDAVSTKSGPETNESARPTSRSQLIGQGSKGSKLRDDPSIGSEAKKRSSFFAVPRLGSGFLKRSGPSTVFDNDATKSVNGGSSSKSLLCHTATLQKIRAVGAIQGSEPRASTEAAKVVKITAPKAETVGVGHTTRRPSMVMLSQSPDIAFTVEMTASPSPAPSPGLHWSASTPPSHPPCIPPLPSRSPAPTSPWSMPRSSPTRPEFKEDLFYSPVPSDILPVLHSFIGVLLSSQHGDPSSAVTMPHKREDMVVKGRQYYYRRHEGEKERMKREEKKAKVLQWMKEVETLNRESRTSRPVPAWSPRPNRQQDLNRQDNLHCIVATSRSSSLQSLPIPNVLDARLSKVSRADDLRPARVRELQATDYVRSQSQPISGAQRARKSPLNYSRVAVAAVKPASILASTSNSPLKKAAGSHVRWADAAANMPHADRPGTVNMHGHRRTRAEDSSVFNRRTTAPSGRYA